LIINYSTHLAKLIYSLKSVPTKLDIPYNDYNKVYFLVVNNKIINPFIIENNKIIAFFNGLTKQRRNSYPLILNKDNIF